MNNSAKQEVILRDSYFAIDENCRTIDSAINSKTLKALQREKPELAVTAENVFKKKNSDQTRALEAYAKWLADSMIRFPASLTWQPDSNVPGMPAIDIPAHSGFDVKINIGAAYNDNLKPYWEFCVQLLDCERSAFFRIVNEFRVYLLFPNLYDSMRADEELAEELGSFRVEEAANIMRLGEESHVWEYMDEIHGLHTMQVIVFILK